MSIYHVDTSIIYKVETVTVTFVDWDAAVLKTETVAVNTDAIPPADPTRYNYIFDGWSGTYTNVQSNTTITATYIYDPTLYAFTTYTFDSCGVTGQIGPTLAQMQTAYAGEVWLSSYFELGAYNGYQKWTVPGDGVYEITAIGANALNGGEGIAVKANITLVKGEKIIIVAGQMGVGGTSTGGGGGSFVVRETGNVPLIIAGGGGGTHDGDLGTNMAGINSTTGQTGSGETSNGGTNGSGGSGGVNNSAYGGGGGGFLSGGTAATNCANSGSGGFNDGLLGGGTCSTAYGGFGGGGGSHGSTGGGGGGGGYSGGGGQGHIDNGGGGGGSYAITTMTVVGSNALDDGRVIVTKL